MVNARYEKARVNGQVVDVALLVAVGVDAEGYRRVLGVEVALGETLQKGSDFLGGLWERGLAGVRLVVSDDHAGVGRARRQHFPGIPWQRCQCHFLQNALERAPSRPRNNRRVCRFLGRWDPARRGIGPVRSRQIAG